MNQEVKDLLFYNARSAVSWLDKDIPENIIKELYNLVIMGPMAFNYLPMRIIFIRSNDAKERLKPAMMEQNIPKTMRAPYSLYSNIWHRL